MLRKLQAPPKLFVFLVLFILFVRLGKVAMTWISKNTIYRLVLRLGYIGKSPTSANVSITLYFLPFDMFSNRQPRYMFPQFDYSSSVPSRFPFQAMHVVHEAMVSRPETPNMCECDAW